jgi:hypothetical protein
MFIIIMEGGEVFKSETINDNDKTAADDGIIDIIDTDIMQQYSEGHWYEMEKWEV